MRLLLSFTILFLTLNALSKDTVVSLASASYKIVSLYEKDALLTGRFLPFKIYDQLTGEPQEVISVTTSSGCYGMVDIHNSELFHLYCRNETQAQASVVLVNGSVLKVPSLDITKLSILEAEKPVIVDPGDSLGQRLFTNNCISCHSSEVIDGVQTKNSLKNTQFKKSVMKQFDGAYDDIQLDALVKYINEEVLQ